MTEKMVSRIDENVLVLERVFDAPRELVFRTFSEAEHLKHWWGPKGWALTHCDIDFRVGGKWHFCMTCQDKAQEYYGMESWGLAVYSNIVDIERIDYLDSFSDKDGNVAENMPETNVAITFLDYENGKTKIVNRAEYVSPEALQTVIDMGMMAGISETWDNLDSYLDTLKQG